MPTREPLTSQAITFITGSSVAGEAIPPHFQFPTKAKTCNGKVRLKVIAKLRGVSGTFGWDEKISFSSSTYTVNENGGITDDKFEKYVMTNITRLVYPRIQLT